MTIEQLLEKLENDRAKTENARNYCYEKVCELRKEIKDTFGYAYNADYLRQEVDDLQIRLKAAEYDERMACNELYQINITINRINKELGQV